MTDHSTWLTKAQAAEKLGVSTKSVERFARAGKLQQASWRPPTGGPELVVYHPEDVVRLASERRPPAAPFVLPSDKSVPVTGPARSRAATDGHPLAKMDVSALGDDVLRTLIATVLSSVVSQTSQTSAARLFVTVPDASKLSGLSQACLRQMIAQGKLAAIRDRGWRIRRRDLEQL